jgi:hypothetical protein
MTMTSRLVKGLIATALLALLIIPSIRPGAAQGSVGGDADRLLAVVGNVDAAVAISDWPAARESWGEFDDLWDQVEDGFRDASRDGYRAIENHQGTIRRLLREDSPDAVRIGSEIGELRDAITAFTN